MVFIVSLSLKNLLHGADNILLSNLFIYLFIYLFMLACLLSGRLMRGEPDMLALKAAFREKDTRHVFGSGHCSALIKLLPGNKDLYISHATWWTYSSMLRVFKLYDTPFSVNGQKGEL